MEVYTHAAPVAGVLVDRDLGLRYVDAPGKSSQRAVEVLDAVGPYRSGRRASTGRDEHPHVALTAQADGPPPSETSTTRRSRGPWTPSTRTSSMSLVALGPLIQVSGRSAWSASARTASGTDPRT